MHAVLFRFSVFEVTSYSAMLALSFVAGAWLAARRAQWRGIDPARMLRLSVYLFASAIAGARLAYGLVNYRTFPANELDFHSHGAVRMSGLVMNGGVVAALVAIWAYTAFHRLPPARTLDAIAPSFALGIALTRVGCFLNGCCFGRVTDLPWGVVFPAGTPAGNHQRMRGGAIVPVHPEQLYLSLAGLVMFAVLLAVERKMRRDGSVTFLAVLLYGVTRFIAEFFREHDSDIGPYLGLNHNQYPSALFCLAGGAGMVWLAVRARRYRRANSEGV